MLLIVVTVEIVVVVGTVDSVVVVEDEDIVALLVEVIEMVEGSTTNTTATIFNSGTEIQV